MKYPLEIFERHLFITINENKWLIDTGSPQTFSDEASIEIAGKTFPTVSSLAGFDAQQLRDFLKIDCLGLIGGDVLNSFNLILHVKGGYAEFTEAPVTLDGQELKMTSMMGVPMINAMINDTSVKAVFDTGAQYGYCCSAELVEQGEFVQAFTDFNPIIGEFDAMLYKSAICLGEIEYPETMGTLPEMASGALSAFGIEAIIGIEVLYQHKMAYLPKLGKIIIQPNK
ncbi:hypothetical protein [Paraferrimonas sp. SM1919]|uniref:hypothetical protein n=1 Tax=Paraferrimonas sp. SM1919 TaxID=2662263 RepID=UPI0013D65157|nr:hypothetical protein [Paraferrimonas sp. SM1919]